ncbi:MAG: SufE family protein [Gammaproteobacteria bacterium]|nr:SufE family protein [Gammaproteobacteria bacterium]
MNIDDIIETLGFFTDWEDRYQFLIEIGEKLPRMDPADQTEATRVHGCMSKVWISAKPSAADPSELTFAGDSDASTVKGLVALLITLYSGKTAQEILQIDADSVFDKMGLFDHLSPTRHVGVYAMVEHIKSLAESSIGKIDECVRDSTGAEAAVS